MAGTTDPKAYLLLKVQVQCNEMVSNIIVVVGGCERSHERELSITVMGIRQVVIIISSQQRNGGFSGC